MSLAAMCWVTAGFGSWACTDVSLCPVNSISGTCDPPGPTKEDNTIRVEGTTCTVDPGWVIFPYKILFVIDQSTSNLISDPSDMRAAAVQRVIDQFIENRAVSYGVIGFSQGATKMTDGFTRDYNVLVPGVISSLGMEYDYTNYLDTVELVRAFIEDDAAKAPEAERHRTRYDIHWLSDGIPDPCQRPEAIFDKMQAISALRAKYGFYDIRLNTIRLFNPGYPVLGCEDVTPLDYLPEMANIGHGYFREFSRAEDINFDIGFTEIRAPFGLQTQVPLFLVNENRYVWENELVADSDGDGLPDEGKNADPNPLVWDSNDDGCSDRVDQALLPNASSMCGDLCGIRIASGEFEDLDADGLPDCAEQTLGYHILRSDTDQDGFTDLLELKFGTSPLDADTLMDPDYDGVPNGEEIRNGTNPLNAEADDSLRYRYTVKPASAETDMNVPGVTCLDFEVQNVQLVHTQSTIPADGSALTGPAADGLFSGFMSAPHKEGENELCVYMVQTPTYEPDAEPTVTRACKRALYLPEIDAKEPVTGVLRFEPSDFHCYTNCVEE